MYKKFENLLILILFLALIVNSNIDAQSSDYYRVEVLQDQDLFEFDIELEQWKNEAPFLSMALIGDAQIIWEDIELRVFSNGQWRSWKTMTKDHHNEIEDIQSFSELQYFSSLTTKFQIRSKTIDKGLIYVDLFYPGNTNISDNVINFRSNCELPTHLTRKKWCPDNSCRWGDERTPTNPTHLIVHHSAGPNDRSNWDAVVRSIWNFHVVTRGWDDIGYNWLISPKGVLYEGRGEGIRGAHFSGHNSGTTGICMMGTYSDVSPTNEALEMLEEFLSWSANKWKIEPLKTSLHTSSGLTLYGVSGHRDGGATSCPGDVLYGKLPTIRQHVQTLLDGCDGIDTTGNGGGGDTITVNRNPNTFNFKWSINNTELKIELGKFIYRPIFIYIYDMSGRLVWRTKMKNQDQIYNLDFLASGIYVIKIENKYIDKLYKIVKI